MDLRIAKQRDPVRRTHGAYICRYGYRAAAYKKAPILGYGAWL
jgi:hypothetical protein